MLTDDDRCLLHLTFSPKPLKLKHKLYDFMFKFESLQADVGWVWVHRPH
jgi:hypothetical protein